MLYLKRHGQKDICSHSKARELLPAGTRDQVLATPEEGKESEQPPDEMSCHCGHHERT